MNLSSSQLTMLERASEMSRSKYAWTLSALAPEALQNDMSALISKGLIRVKLLGALTITPAGSDALAKAKGESDE